MFRSTLLILTLSIGCRAVDTTSNNTNVGHNIDEVAASADTGEGNEQIDTAIVEEDSVDTAVEEAPNCAFEEVTTGNGRVTVGNEFQFALSEESPRGQAIFGYHEVMRINVTSLHHECEDETITFMNMAILTTDNEATGWFASTVREVDVYDLSVWTGTAPTPSLTAEVIHADEEGGWAGPQGSALITAGTTHVFGIWMDITGASADMDDMLQIHTGGSVHFEGSEYPVSYNSLNIDSNTLVY